MELARGSTSVAIEDLNASGVLQLRSLARHVSDASFGESAGSGRTRAAWYGAEIFIADQWLMSFKTGSDCGA
jgi:putative transposase